MAPTPLSTGFQYFTPLSTIKLGPSGAGSQVGGLVHAPGPCGSPTTPPVRLGVSPAAAPTPTGVFNQRFEAVFPRAGALVVWSASLPAVCPVYLCANVGPQGLLVVRLPAPFVPHSTSLGPALATRVLSALVPVSAPPTRLDECLFFISLVSDFLAVRFSFSSGCAGRCSVSTYAAILVLQVALLNARLSLTFHHG